MTKIDLTLEEFVKLKKEVYTMRDERKTNGNNSDRKYYNKKYSFLLEKSAGLFDLIYMDEIDYMPIFIKMMKNLEGLITEREGVKDDIKSLSKELACKYGIPYPEN